jgi:hypothetical protein
MASRVYLLFSLIMTEVGHGGVTIWQSTAGKFTMREKWKNEAIV